MGVISGLLGLLDPLVPFAGGIIPAFIPGVPQLIRETIPLAAQLAPFALPGIGGIAASAGLSLLASNNQNPVQRAGAAAVMARQQCPPMGVPRGGFSRPFQSAFFSSGGSLPGRGMQASFVGGTAIGRPQAGCPPVACPCPGGGGARRGFRGGLTRFAQPIQPPPKVSAQAFIPAPVFNPLPTLSRVIQPTIAAPSLATAGRVAVQPALNLDLSGLGR